MPCLALPPLGRVGELEVFEILHGLGPAHGGGDDVDGDFHALGTDNLCAVDFALGAEEQLQCEGLGSRVIPRMLRGVKEDAAVFEADALEVLFAHPCHGGGHVEGLHDGCALGIAIANVASADAVGRDTALAICGTGKRHGGEVARQIVAHLDDIADRIDVGVARAHLGVHMNVAAGT